MVKIYPVVHFELQAEDRDRMAKILKERSQYPEAFNEMTSLEADKYPLMIISGLGSFFNAFINLII